MEQRGSLIGGLQNLEEGFDQYKAEDREVPRRNSVKVVRGLKVEN